MGFNLSEWALKHRSFVVYVMIAVVAAGIASFISLGRNEDPSFVIKQMVVQASWPGATLDETLLQVTERLERTLKETPELDFLRSETTPGRSIIFVSLKQSTPAAEVPDIWYHVRKSIDDMRQTLPAGVVGPAFNDEFGDTFGIIYGFTADGFSFRELQDKVEGIRNQLLQVPDVTKVEMIGVQPERFFVQFSMRELATLGIDRNALLAALRAQNVVSPAGIIQTGNERLLLRVSGAFTSEQDLLAVNFVVNGRLIRLRDIATVHRGFVDPPQPMFRVNGRPAIGLAIAMREGGDILTLGRNVQHRMQELTANLPVGINPILVADQPQVVRHSISEFTDSLWQAIVIIMAVSFISLGVRAGTVVALAIPLTLAVTFPIMEFFGIDLQRISLGAFIIALSLLVDDAMTTVDVMSARLAAGDGKETAATFAYRSVALAMLTGSFVTAAGFVPIGFAKSSAGEYTFSIFAVVGITLIMSWFVAVIFTPLIGVWLMKAKPVGPPGRLMRGFRSFLTGAMRFKWLTIAITLGCFVVALLVSPWVPRQFFPPSDRPELLVDLRLPPNASIYASEQAATKLGQILAKDADVAHWSTYIGRSTIRFYLPLFIEPPDDGFTQAVVVAKNLAARQRLEMTLDRVLPETFPDAVTNVSPLNLGPPVGWPLQYRVSGPGIPKVQSIARQLAAVVAGNPDARRVNYNWMQPARMVRIQINQDEARLLGLSTQTLASVINTVITGSAVTQVRDGIHLIDVVVRATDEQRLSLETLRHLQVPLPNGQTVPLSQIATFRFGQELPLIWTRNSVPTLTVQADVARGVLPETVVSALAPAVRDFAATLPPGYQIATGGIVEESQVSQASVYAVVPLMLFLMITFLMIQLQSFNRLFLVLSVVPHGMIGVIAALLLFHQPLGFVAILGILALFGMIARNAVILIEQIEAERAAGALPWDAVIEAAVSRFRPITLTAISTVLGMIPIAITIFWGAMAFAIMGGMLVATVLTLIFVPALYVTWFGIKEPRPVLRAEAAASSS
ncbi:MAG: efflux RND transporter permease subunit [Acetobacteraceae bacterium]